MPPPKYRIRSGRLEYIWKVKLFKKGGLWADLLSMLLGSAKSVNPPPKDPLLLNPQENVVSDPSGVVNPSPPKKNGTMHQIASNIHSNPAPPWLHPGRFTDAGRETAPVQTGVRFARSIHRAFSAKGCAEFSVMSSTNSGASGGTEVGRILEQNKRIIDTLNSIQFDSILFFDVVFLFLSHFTSHHFY